MIKSTGILFLCLMLAACGARNSRLRQDEIYSRHLQRHVRLTILNTPLPKDKSELNLLLLNDGQEMDSLRVKAITDSLYEKRLIEPLLVIGIHAGDRMQEFGVSDRPDYQGRGKKAGDYDEFVNNELYPFIKKKAGVRKFHSVAIAGCSLGGLSAFDIAWNHPDKISKVGVFSGSFWWRDKNADDSTYSDEKNRILFNKLKASRKKPGLQYFFYAGNAEESSDRDKDGIIDVIDDTQDLITLLRQKNVAGENDIKYWQITGASHNWHAWSRAFPEFLLWAFHK